MARGEGPWRRRQFDECGRRRRPDRVRSVESQNRFTRIRRVPRRRSSIIERLESVFSGPPCQKFADRAAFARPRPSAEAAGESTAGRAARCCRPCRTADRCRARPSRPLVPANGGGRSARPSPRPNEIGVSAPPDRSPPLDCTAPRPSERCDPPRTSRQDLSPEDALESLIMLLRRRGRLRPDSRKSVLRFDRIAAGRVAASCSAHHQGPSRATAGQSRRCPIHGSRDRGPRANPPHLQTAPSLADKNLPNGSR